jgi:arylsulfatase A
MMNRRNSTRRGFLKTLSVCAGQLVLSKHLWARGDTAGKPNIVIILADDLGYGDLGCYGNAHNATPNIDALARHGLKFTDFHSNGPMCTPTRVALLTGQYQQRFGPAFEKALSGKTEYDHGLPLKAFTMAEAMKDAGYATGMYGKWHLGFHPPLVPTRQGFDDYRGLLSGGGDHHSHIDRSGREDWWHNEQLDMESGYSVDLITRHSVEFIERHKDRPFFLYVPHQAIHFPWQGLDEPAHRESGKPCDGLDKLGPHKNAEVGPVVRQMIEAVDQSVGRIVNTLRKLDLDRRTLVFFTSDNGGYLRYSGGFDNISDNGPLRGQKGDLYEGGHRVPAIAYWPGRIPAGRVTDATVMTMDIFPTLLELVDSTAPDGHDLDGTSILPLLLENEILPERTVFWRMLKQKAVRQGRWKLYMNSNKAELYDLDDDIGEQTDLAARMPERVDTLRNACDVWEREVAQNL